MAMNKKEQAEMEALRQEVRIARALRFTEPVKPDVPPPTYRDSFGALSKGFLFSGSRVEVACSSSVNHAFGCDSKTNRQQSRWLYSTKLLALRAMRNEMEMDFARKLAEVDAEIEEEKAQ